MIVQTIEISLSKGRAPDLLAHVAESGREIEMIPDVELSADDYTAEIDTVKPDGTFTMTNCIIDADGHIIAPIIEQAVAVKGLCHYIIKIYNDDLVIYSACGSLWVDDHLITDDMIESIAEVNGYRFPQDFPTFDDIPTAEDFIDDNALELDKTWSSDKINNELSNIDVMHHYTEQEKVVGTWINGKPLYEVTIHFVNTRSSFSDFVTVTQIANLNVTVTINFTCLRNTDYITGTGSTRQEIATNYCIAFRTSGNNLQYRIDGYGTQITDCYATILYTKTTD